MRAVNYQTQREYITITANTNGFNTACTSIRYRNAGTVAVDLVLVSGKGTLRLEPGEEEVYNNAPDVLENNTYNIVFAAGAGEKKLAISKEHVLRVRGGESATLPAHFIPAPNNPETIAE